MILGRLRSLAKEALDVQSAKRVGRYALAGRREDSKIALFARFTDAFA